MEPLAALDLNLLVALDVLLQERSVTRSARRLAITQSAMSQTLQRLRTVFDDPLLVRRGPNMVATPRAEDLAGPLRSALRSLAQAITEPVVFEPATSERVFRVAMLDVHSVSVLPRLLARLRATATRLGGVALDVVPVDMDLVIEQLRRGDVDVALVMPRETRTDIMHETVLEESLVVMVRVGHPLLRGRPSAKAVLAYPHVTFRVTGRGLSAVDEALLRQGASRRVALRLPYFLAAPTVLASSDFVAMVPQSLALTFMRSGQLALLEAPFGPSRYPMEMVWARQFDADPGHRWLRTQLREAAQEVAMLCRPTAKK